MSWQALLADLEDEFEGAASVALAAEVADRTRREAAQLRLADRLRPAIGSPVRISVMDVGPVSGRLDAVGPDWLLVTEPSGREALVPSARVAAVRGLSGRSAHPGSEGVVGSRRTLGHALRRLARDRVPVTVVLAGADRLRGTLDRVGRDFVEVTELDRAETGVRSGPAGRGSVVTVPMTALLLVRSG